MPDTETQEQPQPPAHHERRRNPRVEVQFSVRIDGRTAEGESFTLRADVDKISCAGATLISEDPRLAKDLRMTIEPPFGDQVEAEVNGVWTDSSDGLRRVGVRLLDGTTWFNE